MFSASAEPPTASSQQLVDEVERLRAENGRLRTENRRLRTALDAHIARARSAQLYGPTEMTAGTCVGPHFGADKDARR